MLPRAITLSLDRAEFENSVPSGLENPRLFISPLGLRPNDNRFDAVEVSEAIESDLSSWAAVGAEGGAPFARGGEFTCNVGGVKLRDLRPKSRGGDVVDAAAAGILLVDDMACLCRRSCLSFCCEAFV